MKENVSPEEKLLRLIRGANKTHSEQSTGAPIPQQPACATLKAGRLTFPANAQRHFTVINARKTLIIILYASLTYLAYTLVAQLFNQQTITIHQEAALKTTANETTLTTETRPYESYIEGMRNRQIFAGVELAASNPAATSVANLDVLKDINLVGIISGENPQAIVEDKKNQKTYYLNKGQSMGEIQVEEIMENKVILNYHGQRLELHL